MSLDSLVNVSITTQAQSISRAGFGVPMIMAYHANYLDVVRTYTNLASMVSDGFATTDPAYLAAQVLLSQDPKVVNFKVGKRASAPTQGFTLTPTDTTEDLVYTLDINGNTASYTVVALDGVAEIIDGLKIAIDALSLAITVTDNATSMDIDADVAGAWFSISNKNKELSVEDVTADPGISADIDAVIAADNDWYGLIIADAQSNAQIAAAAANIEAKIKIYGYDGIDDEILDSGVSDDVMSTLETAAYARSYGVYHPDNNAFAAAAWMGNMFPKDPGSATWKFKTLAGVPATSLSASDQSDVQNKSGNIYVTVGGVNITCNGISASNEFLDITRGVDWLRARIQEEVYAALVNNDKIPYTNLGVELIKGKIRQALEEGIAAGLLSGELNFNAGREAYLVSAPLVAAISDLDKANRSLPDVEFQAKLAGAIHSVTISGVVSV